MSQIQIHNLTFAYEGQEEPVFENADVTLDTDWKLGLIGRNGKGKTTFLRILNGELPYQGTITGRIPTDRFPYPLTQADAEKTGSELLPVWKPGAEEWQVLKEMPDLALDAALLYQPIGRLSQGEKSKLMLAVLFAEENAFLLIDEPANHLDARRGRVSGSILRRRRDSSSSPTTGIFSMPVRTTCLRWSESPSHRRAETSPPGGRTRRGGMPLRGRRTRSTGGRSEGCRRQPPGSPGGRIRVSAIRSAMIRCGTTDIRCGTASARRPKSSSPGGVCHQADCGKHPAEGGPSRRHRRDAGPAPCAACRSEGAPAPCEEPQPWLPRGEDTCLLPL